mgnify:CR=1 FL=1
MDTIEKLVDDLLSSPLTDQGNIIVDDFSTDGTREILINKIGDLVDQIIFHDNNHGKGRGVLYVLGLPILLVMSLLFKMQTLNITLKSILYFFNQ